MLVTMKVRVLYTGIPHNEGLKAVETTLKQKNIFIKVIIKFLQLVLLLNNFAFSCKHYPQMKNCAMATKCAPNLR